MTVTYLLEDSSLSGTARTVIAQADALSGRGHHVRIVTTGLPVTWTSSRAEWVYVDDVRQYAPGSGERVVQSTSEIIRELPIVDDAFYRERMPAENDPLRVLLAGASQNEAKRLEDGYGAAAHARWFHQSFELVRVAPWAPSREEPLDSVQEFHVALTTSEITRLIHSCDVLVAPAVEGDPAALTTREALAAGLACVLADTAAHRALASLADYAAFAREGSAVELGEKLIDVLADGELRGRLRRRAREVAEPWRAEKVVLNLERRLTEG